MSHHPAIAAIAAATDERGAELEYRLSLNTYSGRASEHTAKADETLFAYHVDLPGNGDVTAIITLLSPGWIQFAASPELLAEASAAGGLSLPDEENPETIMLPPGSLLVARDIIFAQILASPPSVVLE